jgi:hypothetical protein
MHLDSDEKSDMSTDAHDSVTVWRFIRSNAARITIGLMLAAAACGAVSIWMPYQRELRIARRIGEIDGKAAFDYNGPNWVPESTHRWLPFCSRIFHVSFYECKLPPRILLELKPLAHLSMLDFNNSSLTDADLEHSQEFTNVIYLILSSTQITDGGLEQVKRFKNVKYLSLSYTQIDGTGLRSLRGLTNLWQIKANDTQVTDAGLQELEQMTNLKYLDFYNTRVTNQGLKHLIHLKHLNELSLGRTQVDDAGLEYLKDLTGLRQLNLIETQTTPEGRASLRKALPNCKIEPQP